MTRHNLGDHLSWLLNNRHIPPVGPTIPISGASTVAVESVYAAYLHSNVNDESLPRQEAQSTQSARAHTITERFVRPLPPSAREPKTSHQPSPTSKVQAEENAMARLQSAGSSKRPSLLNQQHLATPASSKSSSLAASWTASFRKEETPNSHDPSAKSAPAPRVYQTPQFSSVRGNRPESVDLTGNDEIATSSPETFGEPRRLWDEAAASRAEPRGKKRKSHEMSDVLGLGTVVDETGKENQAPEDTSDDFLDIELVEGFDNIAPPPPYSETYTPPTTSGNKLSTERMVKERDPESDYEEEYSVSETITRRVETHTRRTLSRIPSACEAIKSVQDKGSVMEGGGRPQVRLSPSSNPLSKLQSPARIENPRSNPSHNPSLDRHVSILEHKNETPAPRIPQLYSNLSEDRVIEDSEDDEMLSQDGQEAFENPSEPELDRSVQDVGRSFSSPKPSSVLLPASGNIGLGSVKHECPPKATKQKALPKSSIRQESVPSPFHLDSPTRRLDTFPEAQVKPSPQTPTSDLSADDRKLVQMFLSNQSSIEDYASHLESEYQRKRGMIENILSEGELIPDEIKVEYQQFLERRKLVKDLPSFSEQYAALVTEKKQAARDILAGLDKCQDVTEFEDKLRATTNDVKAIEEQVKNILYASGAVDYGFGTTDVAQGPSQAPSVARSGAPAAMQEGLAKGTPLAFGSSNTHSSVVLQTQVGSASFTSKTKASALPPVSRNVVTTSHKSYCDDDYPPDVKDEDDMLGSFAYTSSAKGKNRAIEDYDDLNDDEDMLELAESFEMDQSFANSLSAPSTREVQIANPTSSKSQKSKIEERHSFPSSQPRRELLKFRWSQQVERVLKDRFRLYGFRQNQLEAINATLNGEDAFVLMPTGGGKSLCYQLPAVVQSGKTKGVTIVVSPLLSLMHDQVEHLQKLRIQAMHFNGDTPADDKKAILQTLRDPLVEQTLELLYFSPEMLNLNNILINTLRVLYKNGKFARIVIDEAHCVSQWGHDFRPDYKALGTIRKQFPGVPILALTATATENVKADVMHNLGILGCKVFSQSFNRPNLSYEIRPKKRKKDVMDNIAELINSQYRGQSGIIYALSRKDCENIAQDLRDNYNINAAHYHALLHRDEKMKTQKSWQAGRIKVIVATIAFGMGIDKPDVRFVIHFTLPKSLEGYYQETGRAGRDGKKSGCYLYYGFQDTSSLLRMIDDGDIPHDQKDRQRKMLNRVVQFCENKSDCRRVMILEYFGEIFKKEDCNHTCDNCSSDSVFETHDFTEIARAALSVVKDLRTQNITVTFCSDVIRGRKAGYDGLKGYGVAHHLKEDEVDRIIYRLMSEEALTEEHVVNRSGFANPYLRMSRAFKDFVTGKRKLKLQVRVSPSGPKTKGPAIKRKRPGTGVGAAMESHPQSTNVSSPIRSAARRKKAQNSFIDEEAGVEVEREDEYDEYDSEAVDHRGYARNGFVVSDNEESDDDFEPVRQGKPLMRSRAARKPGPPITTDDRLTEANLSDVHRDAMYEFVHAAKKLEEQLRNDKNLKKPIFVEQHFREMAINWTTTLEDMSEIPGIDQEKLDKWGPKFLPLVRQFHQNYEEAVGHKEERDMDGNHQNVINLLSDDEPDEYPYSGDEDLLQEESSRYFVPADNTPYGARTNAQSGSSYSKPKPSAPARSRSGSGRGGSTMGNRSRYQKAPRKASGSDPSYTRGRGEGTAGAATKRKPSSSGVGAGKRSFKAGTSQSASSNVFQKFVRKDPRAGSGSGSGAAGRSTGSAGGGIGMMPT